MQVEVYFKPIGGYPSLLFCSLQFVFIFKRTRSNLPAYFILMERVTQYNFEDTPYLSPTRDRISWVSLFSILQEHILSLVAPSSYSPNVPLLLFSGVPDRDNCPPQWESKTLSC